MPVLEYAHTLFAVCCHPDVQLQCFHEPQQQHLVVELVLDDEDAVAGLAGREARHLALSLVLRCRDVGLVRLAQGQVDAE